ncbi:MAG: helix-turn-helix transcriptional regulator [Hamadaea sp.]|nr:helix-turn-helix transcriptional regulator [Hamadaea sp.]NUT21936.1 helix-turn-helix transcriptional regulator [Hamadaea sp.]
MARALGVVGERWALLVVRELLLGPKRFTELSRGLPGLSQNVLSQRLRELEESGVVRKRRLGPPVSATAYELTELGALLDPVLISLATFGSRLPLPSAETPMSADAFVLALRTTFDPDASKTKRDGTFELRLDDDVFRASIQDGTFKVARGIATAPDAVITGSVAAVRAVVFGGRPLTEGARPSTEGGRSLTEEVQVSGDRRAAERFVRLFPRPATVTG